VQPLRQRLLEFLQAGLSRHASLAPLSCRWPSFARPFALEHQVSRALPMEAPICPYR
jgi:hypothetical protein